MTLSWIREQRKSIHSGPYVVVDKFVLPNYPHNSANDGNSVENIRSKISGNRERN